MFFRSRDIYPIIRGGKNMSTVNIDKCLFFYVPLVILENFISTKFEIFFYGPKNLQTPKDLLES